jgi:DNA polymerase-3 subunit alpha
VAKYINLRVYSDYSLGYGASKVKDIVKYAAYNNYPAVALTDNNNLFASLEFSTEASKSGVQPIIGVNLNVKYLGVVATILLLAKDENGYQNLLKLSSNAYLNREHLEVPHVLLQEVLASSDGLLAIVGGYDGLFYAAYQRQESEAIELLKQMHDSFADRLYLEIQRENGVIDQEYETFVIDRAYELNIPLVATNPTAFLKPESSEAQDVVLCISNSRFVLESDRPKSNPFHYFRSHEEMVRLFEDIPEAIANTHIIAQRCAIMSFNRDPMLPRFGDDPSVKEEDELANQARIGLKERLSDKTEEEQKVYFERLDYELAVINKMQYAGYFLIVSDFIKWSKVNGIPVGPGRGSGAGSVVAWSLQITDLDPLRFGLLFERFLNPERVSMPDFDIDFCQDRREEVIEYVQQKYGKDRVAQIITFGKLQARIVLRDVGRVLHMPYPVIDRICKMVPNNPTNPVTLKEAISLDKELQRQAENNHEIDRLLKLSLQLEGLNRHVSTHAAGIIIADRNLTELIPLYKDENSLMPAVQYSMKYAEAAGLVKFDFLGLKTLTVISWAVNLINRNGHVIDINKIPLDDKKSFEMLSRGETVGVFQFESAGMREAIKKLKPDCVDDLIALGSLYRPGPMDNIPRYIARKHGLEKPEYLHPMMEPILKETYGIIVYQEQVMEIAKVLGGYTLAGADLLRRAMGKKIKAEMDAQREIFITGAINNGIDKKIADEIFALMEKFASYGFNKSHAAAYAIISYQTAYIKANYPLEFMVASMNLEINFTDKIAAFVAETKRLGIEVLPIDVNHSYSEFAIEGSSVRYALSALKNVGAKSCLEITQERDDNGKFKDIFDFFERVNDKALNKRLLENLAKSGAFDCLYENRKEICDNAELLGKYSAQSKAEKNNKQMGLFGLLDDDSSVCRPALIKTQDWSPKQKLEAEFEAVGFFLSKHPLEAYATKLAKMHVTESLDVEHIANKSGAKICVAGVVTSKKIRSSAKGKYAFIQISDRSGLLEISIFNEELLYRSESILEIGSTILANVDAKLDDSGIRVIVERIVDLDAGLTGVKTKTTVTILDKSIVPQVSAMITNSGRKIHLQMQMPSGEIVSFKSANDIYLSEENLETLKGNRLLLVSEI